MSKFRATQNEFNNGFHITFKNGYTVSVQFNKRNYSDGGETTAEVAAWGPDREWVKLSEGDDVRGWCSPDEVLEIMNMVASKGSEPKSKELSTFWKLYLIGFIIMTAAVIITLITAS
jgi:hypothetical protein